MGSQIIPLLKEKAPRKGKPPNNTLVSPQALHWMGQGAEIEIKRGAKWHRAIVLGQNRGRIVVRHPKRMRQRKASASPRAVKGNNEIVEYPDIETRGCRIVTMKRWAEHPQCPHGGWEPTCGCTHCDDTMWPRLLTKSRWQMNMCLTLLEMSPEHRLSWIGLSLFFTLWKVQASVKQPEESAPNASAGTDECTTGTDNRERQTQAPTLGEPTQPPSWRWQHNARARTNR